MPWTRTYRNRDEFERAFPQNAGVRGLAYRDAILEATVELMEEDSRVFVMGQGVDDAGGVFGTTKGLHERFGKGRCIDTALAENGITGIAAGAALCGMRPILAHMRVDFIPLSLDQIINHAAKWSYMFGGRASVPLTIRAIIGRGWGSAAQHSQSLQSILANIPGLKVVMPATPYDAKGLLRAAVKDNNPVIIIEHRWLYDHTGHVPEGPYTVPIGKAVVRRAGKDVTIAALSYMVYEALLAAEELKGRGIECEVIDLRTIKPMDTDLITESVKKTGRLITVDTGWRECGIGAEVVASAVEGAFGSLKAAPVRISLPEAPTPASPALEALYYPGKKEIVYAIEKMVRAV
ncbi:MAG: alpha-ketoacid dehydrogenase subunit beta [Deltaproteobacteria bacterium]|nr:alpha-ketoacid dehydrogenase subunit beta [Deltaproteobacteria bacterium]